VIGRPGILATNTLTVATYATGEPSVPILFVAVSDPVAQGFVASQARPGGNPVIGSAAAWPFAAPRQQRSAAPGSVDFVFFPSLVSGPKKGELQ
jgi:hypothetical protein